MILRTGLDRMKPTRIRMCHALVMNYGLYRKMEIYVSSRRRSHCLHNTLTMNAKPASQTSE